jgi:hypothetical protein
MLRNLSIAAAALALAACAGPAATSATTERDCFRAIDVDGFGIVDEHRVRVSVSPTRHYYLTISPDTDDLDWEHVMTLVSPTNFICTGNGWDVELRAGDPPRSYRVVTIERAPPEEPAPTGS